MTAALPFRSAARNVAHATAAPAAFLIVAERATGRDGFEPLLRGEHAGSLLGAMRHARTVCASLALRHARVRVRVEDATGRAVFACTSEGGAL